MSDSKSDMSDNRRAFEGESTAESSSSELGSAHFKGTDTDSVEGAESSVEALGTYSPTKDLDNDRPSMSGHGSRWPKFHLPILGEGFCPYLEVERKCQ